MQHFSDVPIVPLTELMDAWIGKSDHKGGPIWPDWDRQVESRHRRNGRTVDVRPEFRDAERLLENPVAWGGVIYNHFGHQISDFSMRLLPTVAEHPGMPVVYMLTEPTHQRYAKVIPGYFWSVCEWFGVSRENIIVSDKPMRARELHVAPQIEQLVQVPINDHWLDHLTDLVDRKMTVGPKAGLLYVSRASQRGRIAGEAFLEKLFIEAGGTVLRPEQLPLHDQLRLYASHAQVVFSEGSALHACQLLGRQLNEVHVIARRKGSRVAEAFLRRRAQDVFYHDAVQHVIFPLNKNNKPAMPLGLSIMSPDFAMSCLQNINARLAKTWDTDRYRQEVMADAAVWAQSMAAHPAAVAPTSVEQMLTGLDSAGLSWLVPAISPILKRTGTGSPTPSAPVDQPKAEGRERMSILPKAIKPVIQRFLSGIRSKKETTMTAIPQSWTNRRIETIIAELGYKSYLEIGLFKGDTFKNIGVEYKVGVDPDYKFDAAEVASDTVEVHKLTSDDYFAGLDTNKQFDLIFIDGLHTFEQTYRDLCNAILHSRTDSVLIIDDTVPMDVYAAIPNQRESLKARDEAKITVRGWHGDVYKVIFAIHDFHPGLDYCTIIGSGNPQTLVWRSKSEKRSPAFNSLETISRLDYFAMRQNFNLMKPATEAEAMRKCLEAARANR